VTLEERGNENDNEHEHEHEYRAGDGRRGEGVSVGDAVAFRVVRNVPARVERADVNASSA
jgi:hypothetical protein